MNLIPSILPLGAQRRVAICPAIRVFMITMILGLVSSSAGAEDSVRVAGTDGTAQTWTVGRIRQVMAAELRSVEFTSHGQKHTANAVPLLAVLKASGAPAELKMDPKADPHVKNANLRLAVVVQAGDGYTATFSLAELLPEIGGREAWLALDEDGKPLPTRDGLAKLIVPADLKPARWVRDVTSITVVDPATATTRPASKP